MTGYGVYPLLKEDENCQLVEVNDNNNNNNNNNNDNYDNRGHLSSATSQKWD